MAKGIIFGILLIAFIFFVTKISFVIRGNQPQKNRTKFIVRVAVFGSISAILYIVPFLKFPIPIFPSFLEFHFDEIPVFIASFAYGPFSGLCILLLKTLLKLPFTTTLCVGEIADLCYSAAFILPAAIIYSKNRHFKNALIGIGIGCACQLVVSLVLNVYVMFPFYMKMFGLSEQGLLKICQVANPKITNVGWSVGLLAVLPFNIIKDAAVITVTLLVYKTTHTFIDRLQDN